MIQEFVKAIRVTAAAALLYCFGYLSIVYGVAQLTPSRGEGVKVFDAKGYHHLFVGQAFISDSNFWSRPSAAGYDASASCGSNKGPANPEYLALVMARRDSFLAHNPGIDPADIPSDLLTASGSGIDPDISLEAALVQVKRIAAVRKVKEEKLVELVKQLVKQPAGGFLGGPKVLNVLQLNIALNKL